ncbi:50S ribosomal protein L13, chloroplastic-like isoform X3 [Prosopis cineraria]|uniref:50S ribosomal protein L13, chloroplastic-like isoform X3 n=1 Tax=Prosopis cineraria TaxID=364024 RepID=UPI00240F6BA4|nr:50S ribosomal protein L13, chloroplastic-like isoform X3 [Prosopis cineraria]
MALVCGSTSVTFPSTSAPSLSPHKSSNAKSSFLGFRLALSKSSIWPSVPVNSRESLQVRCLDLSIAPKDERFMFEESKANGPDIWNMTSYPKAADHVNTDKPWCIVDASDKILGRLASTIAIYIRGKNLAAYTPSVDMGAFAIVVIAEKVAVSGKKRTQKLYRRHSGRPGGMKVETFAQLQQRIPERIIEHAVRGMLPKGRKSVHPPKGF